MFLSSSLVLTLPPGHSLTSGSLSSSENSSVLMWLTKQLPLLLLHLCEVPLQFSVECSSFSCSSLWWAMPFSSSFLWRFSLRAHICSRSLPEQPLWQSARSWFQTLVKGADELLNLFSKLLFKFIDFMVKPLQCGLELRHFLLKLLPLRILQPNSASLPFQTKQGTKDASR